MHEVLKKPRHKRQRHSEKDLYPHVYQLQDTRLLRKDTLLTPSSTPNKKIQLSQILQRETSSKQDKNQTQPEKIAQHHLNIPSLKDSKETSSHSPRNQEYPNIFAAYKELQLSKKQVINYLNKTQSRKITILQMFKSSKSRPLPAKSCLPISLLPSISKTAEQFHLSRLNDHLKENNIFIPEQFDLSSSSSSSCCSGSSSGV
ncbi:hypothetical protein AVEN_178971-1 [Araneus ventricosus]|uniref:Uncharacterized protein n=1 Tax=Araneus ventricosus TaxID=182803 RepID=A0A4Y2N0P4_ARAVE|nr:hypothetical protein AVEN_178971-1 [Araneus ventricosus]